MSGPIFVLDAQGTPLMPMGAAHARTLLARGTAQRISHHTFTIIQLARSYTHPVVRPVLLHITMYWRTTALLLLAEQRRGVVPFMMLLMERHRAGWVHHIYPYHGHALADSTIDKMYRRAFRTRLVHSDEESVRRLSQVIAYLRMLVPLSHVVVDVVDSHQRVRLSRVVDTALGSLQITVLSPNTFPQTLSPLFAATVDATQQRNWRYLPLFYVNTTYSRAGDTTNTVVSLAPSRRAIRSMVGVPDDLLVVYQDNHRLQIGLFAPWRESYSPAVLVPIAVAPTHIVWRWSDLSQSSRFWPLQTDDIVFMPMY